MSRTGSAVTKNKKNQKMRGGGAEIAIISFVPALAGMLTEIILSLLNIRLSSGLKDFVVDVVMLVTFISMVMYVICRGFLEQQVNA